MSGNGAATPKRPRRFRRGLYLIPSALTTLNLAAGFYAILQIMHGSQAEPWHFDLAAKAIGIAAVFDFLDGTIARLTGSSSDFGKEYDSLADVVTFGVAPAFLAYNWGLRLLPELAAEPEMRTRLLQFGAVACFIYLLCGAARLARFNITDHAVPSNPGRPDRKYFVGMPIPAAAGVIASIVHINGGEPVATWWISVIWLLLVGAAAFLMVSTWRFYSFKNMQLSQRRPFRTIIILGALIALIWAYSGPVLFIIALGYMFFGVYWRLVFILRHGKTVPAAQGA